MSFFDVYDLKRIENLELLAKKVVEGFIIGLHKSPFHGFSVEFAEHRPYNPGEGTKNLDWKVYARTDKLFVKKYEEETNLRCHIVLDTSSSMYFPKDLKIKDLSFNKLQFSALAAASLMNLLKKQRDAFGLSLFGTELDMHTPARSSSTHYKLLLGYLEQVVQNNVLNKRTSTAKVLHQVAERIHKRSLVMIFSDFFDEQDNTEELFAALQHLNYNKHEVVVFHVVDKPLEMEFDFENRPHLFIDLESGEEVRVQSNEIKSAYIEKVNERQERIKQKCLQYKIDYVETDIRKGYYPILRKYLVKRQKISK
ncbi:MAG: hypothetical protein ACI9FN_000489 [Saprospiraceae bacterium]|jgi:uncharacterized protein (DUF58 family)